MIISRDTTLEPRTYLLPEGIIIDGDDVTLNGNGAHLVGAAQSGVGVQVNGRSGVTITNLSIANYTHGIRAADCRDLHITHCTIRQTAEVAANTLFLDIWRAAADSYGGAILLVNVVNGRVDHNDLQHQMNGLLLYGCRQLTVSENNASYSSGFGIYLHQTCDSQFTQNFADYCCRYQPRSAGAGHMGADAAGFVIVYGSCRNVFHQNMARLGGDGFFLAGLTPQGEHVGCDDNLFSENDGSYSPNIAFEGTFSRGNIYRKNKANYGNYGFWLGFSSGCQMIENEIYRNRQAGIAVENGVEMVVRGNTFWQNQYGVLLWSRHVAQFAQAVPQNDTSRNWLIEQNRFVQDRVGVRLAANQDHGTRPLPATTPPTPLPQQHLLRHNRFEQCQTAVAVHDAEPIEPASNEFQGSLVADVVQQGASHA